MTEREREKGRPKEGERQRARERQSERKGDKRSDREREEVNKRETEGARARERQRGRRDRVGVLMGDVVCYLSTSWQDAGRFEVRLGVAGAGEEDWAGAAAVPPVSPVGPLTDSSITASVRQKARKGDMEKAGEGLDRWDRGRGPPPLSLSAIWKFTMLCGV